MARSSSCTSRTATRRPRSKRPEALGQRGRTSVSTRTTLGPHPVGSDGPAALLETVRRLDDYGDRPRRHRPASPVAGRRLPVAHRARGGARTRSRCRRRQEARPQAQAGQGGERRMSTITAGRHSSAGRRRDPGASGSRLRTRSSSRDATWSRSRGCPRSSSSSWCSRSCSCCCSCSSTRTSSRRSPPGWTTSSS